MADEASPTGQELMEEVKKEPTLDELLNRNPRESGEEYIRNLVLIERKNRAIFISKDEEKKGGAVKVSLERRQENVDDNEPS